MKWSKAILLLCTLTGCGPIADKMVGNLNTLTIHNWSGQDFTKLTVKRGKGAVLPLEDFTDGSTRGAFIYCRRDETQTVTLCAYLPSGQTIATNFLVVVSPKRLQDFNVEIDTGVVFHVTATTK